MKAGQTGVLLCAGLVVFCVHAQDPETVENQELLDVQTYDEPLKVETYDEPLTVEVAEPREIATQPVPEVSTQDSGKPLTGEHGELHTEEHGGLRTQEPVEINTQPIPELKTQDYTSIGTQDLPELQTQDYTNIPTQDIVLFDPKKTSEAQFLTISEQNRVGEVNQNWRSAGNRFSSADTARLMDELGAQMIDGQLRLQVSATVLFEFDSTVIREEASEELEKVAHLIRSHEGQNVYVVGHTDGKGSTDYNLTLSQNRSLEVMRWLNGNEAIPASILLGHGAGEAYPVAPNTHEDGSDNPEGRAKNRRVEIIITS